VRPIRLDAIIIGGGVAGLFTLAKLRQEGYQAVLLDRDALGSGQTICSQGIIHGGTKYALLGKSTAAQQQLANMPDYWRSCLSGRGDIDLSHCQVMAQAQCMWSPAKLSSAITGFFASRLMQSHVAALPVKKRPPALRHASCRGLFYALDEPVINPQSLLRNFATRLSPYIITNAHIELDKHRVNTTVNGHQYTFIARRMIFTAGNGNAAFSPHQHTRPLRMFYVRVPRTFGDLFVHILGASDKPRLTITSYPNDDHLIWYLGGDIAEKGAELPHDDAIGLVKKALIDIFPWLNFTRITFDSFIIDRAEGSIGGEKGQRPNIPTIITEDQHRIIAWPTKLAMAPILADRVCALMHIAPTRPVDVLPAWPLPTIAKLPWQ